MSDFKAFAASGGANVVTQSAFVADTTVLNNGFSTGIADPLKLNKVWRQSSIMGAVLAQFIEDMSTVTSVDDGTTTGLLARLKTLIGGRVAHTWLATDYVFLPGGLIVQWGFSTSASTSGTITYPIAFTTCLGKYAFNHIDGTTSVAFSNVINIYDWSAANAATVLKWSCTNANTNVLTSPGDFFWMAIGV